MMKRSVQKVLKILAFHAIETWFGLKDLERISSTFIISIPCHAIYIHFVLILSYNQYQLI
jgi:hypothetical protein